MCSSYFGSILAAGRPWMACLTTKKTIGLFKGLQHGLCEKTWVKPIGGMCYHQKNDWLVGDLVGAIIETPAQVSHQGLPLSVPAENPYEHA